jgi:hypothetical protein
MRFGKQKIKKTTADKWFSKYIRYRDEWTCQNPKCNKQFDPKDSKDRRRLHCAHIGYGRAHIPTRWEAVNCMALCINCHDWVDQHPMRAFWLMSQKLSHQEIVWLQLQYKGRTRGRIPKYVEKEAREKYKLLCRGMGLKYND